MKKNIGIALVNICVMFFVACSSIQYTQSGNNDHAQLLLNDLQLNTNANFLELNCSLKSIELQSADATAISNLYRNFSLKLNRNLSFGGNALCNSYFGNYIVNGYDIKFSILNMTRMGCGSNLETEISKIFQQINNYSIDDKHLFLKNNNNILIEMIIE